MKIFYRISDIGYNKVKPDYINNEKCLKNFTSVFVDNCHVNIIADNVSDETYNMICQYVEPSSVTKVSVGHGAGTFNLALDEALKLNDSEYVYFVENDYLHLPNSYDILKQGLDLGFPYVTLYDHPDKYMDPSLGGNPLCAGGAEVTRLYRTYSKHWKITNSTTMTFAASVDNLKKDEKILRKWTKHTHPDDFQMFLDLGRNSRKVISCVPAHSTHGETQWLAPMVDWSKYA